MDTTPGNIRKLQNVIEQSVILSESGDLAVDESWFAAHLPASDAPRVSLNKRILDQEREMIEAALTEANGRVSGAAGAAAKLGTPLPWNRKSKLSAPAKQNARRLDSHCHGPVDLSNPRELTLFSSCTPCKIKMLGMELCLP